MLSWDIFLITRQGLPTATQRAGMSRVTTLTAPTVEPIIKEPCLSKSVIR